MTGRVGKGREKCIFEVTVLTFTRACYLDEETMEGNNVATIVMWGREIARDD